MGQRKAKAKKGKARQSTARPGQPKQGKARNRLEEVSDGGVKVKQTREATQRMARAAAPPANTLMRCE